MNPTHDDNYLFVSNENAGTIDVVDLEKAHRAGFDRKYLLYTTTERARPEDNWPHECPSEEADRPEKHSQGAVLVIDVVKAKRDPVHSILARTPAGCSPVRLTLSRMADQAYVSARGSNAVVALDTARMVRHSRDARLATIPVGAVPVGIAMIDDSHLMVANSDRFSTARKQNGSLSILDVAKFNAGKEAIVRTIPAGSFPR